MLVSNIDKISNLQQLLNRGVYLEPKIDGIRMIVIFKDGQIEYLSRGMKSLTRYVSSKFDKNFVDQIETYDGMVIDGELFNLDWSRTSGLKRKVIDPELLASAKFFIFDIFPFKNFDEQLTYTVGYEKRKKSLEIFYNSLKNKRDIVFVDYISKENDLKQIASVLDRTVSKFEGIVGKVAGSPYEFKRSKYWIRFTKANTEDVPCIGKIDSDKIENAIKAITVVNPKTKIVSNVGTGFSIDDRRYFYENPGAIVGHMVEIKYKSIASAGAYREPVFLRVRYDKDNEFPDWAKKLIKK